MEGHGRRRLLLVGGLLGTVLVGVVAKRAFDIWRERRRFHVRVERLNGHKTPYLVKEDLLKVLHALKAQCRQQITAITVEYRAKRRKVIDSPMEYEAKVKKMYRKIERCYTRCLDKVLRDYRIDKQLLERSVELHNCRAVSALVESLTAVEPDPGAVIDQRLAKKIIASHKKLYDSLLDSTDISCMNGDVLSAIVEDRIFMEYGVEMNDLLNYCQRLSQTQEIKSDLLELKESLTSLQRVNRNLFKV